jgi:hypothetical protein
MKKNESDLPEGWSIPDDMAKRISELVNKKPYAPEDDLQDALEDMARDIAISDLVFNPLGIGTCFTNKF